jgi:hypothetical protein
MRAIVASPFCSTKLRLADHFGALLGVLAGVENVCGSHNESNIALNIIANCACHENV